MNNISQRDIIKYKRALNRLIKKKNDIFIRNGSDPSDGSIAKSECQVFPRQEYIEAAFKLADAIIEVSADHLLAFIKSLSEPTTAMAPWTCIRGAIELSALAAWILDPKINSVIRVRQYFAYKYKSLEEERKYGEVIKDDIGVQKTKQDIDDTESIAVQQLGYKPIKDKNNKRIGIGEPMPKITNIIIKMLDKEDIYRFSSAMAHGQHWAFISCAFTKISNNNAHVKYIDPRYIRYLFLEGAHSFMRPVWYKAKLYDWDLKSITKIFNSFFNSMDRTDEYLRFWED